MAKQVFIHTRLSRAYLALARLSCMIDIKGRNYEQACMSKHVLNVHRNTSD